MTRMRRLFVCSAPLFVALVTICPQVWAQSRVVNLGKSLVRLANPGTLSMPGMPGMPTTFPNTYASNPSASFDPNTGSSGTLHLSYNFTGTTDQSPMCSYGNAKHYPIIGVQLFNKGNPKSYHSSQGYQVAPCIQMNQTQALAFDLGADACTLDLLSDGTCTLEEQEDEVFCIYLNASFAFFIKNWEFESATTVSQVVDGSPGAYFLEPYCAASSDPPDWFGPFGSDTYGTGYFVATEFLIRTQIFGKSFYGVPWKALSPVGPAGQWPSGGPKPICTMYDHGCSFVDQTCTAKATTQEKPGLYAIVRKDSLIRES